MLLLSGGCSLISGYELSDWCQGRSMKVWPALWAKSHGYEHETVAQNGLSNEGIAREVTHYCENNLLPDLVIVQWTYLCRYELRFNHDINGQKYQSLTPWSYIVEDLDKIVERTAAKWKDLPDSEQEKLKQETKRHLEEVETSPLSKVAKFWFELINCRETELYHSLRAIVYLKNYLENKKINYVFSAAEEIILPESNTITDIYIKDLIKQAKDSKWILFGERKRGFTRWAEDNKFKMGPHYHPLEQAHQAAYELVKSDLDLSLVKSGKY